MRLITVPIKVVLVDGLGRMLVRMLVGIVLVLVLLAALWIAMVPKVVPVPVGVRSCRGTCCRGWPSTSPAKGMSTTFSTAAIAETSEEMCQ